MPVLESPSPALLRALLEGFGAFTPAPRLLGDLTPAQAAAKAPSLPHSVAELVAHAHFWQRWILDVAEGSPPRPVPHAAEGWPAVGPGGWEGVRAAFLEGLERAKRLAEDPERLRRPLLEQPHAGWERHSVGSALADLALHNAHHLGQAVAVRQALGLWPPQGGGVTW